MKTILLALNCFLATTLVFAGDCKLTAHVCADATASKIIDGATVLLSEVGGCWKYTDTYDCLEAGTTNYCAPLDTAGCVVTSSVCSTKAFNGDCEMETKTYRCGDSIGTPANTIVLSDTYTLVQDSLDRSACASLDANASCSKAGSICLEGPETRVINGLGVYKDCWKYEDQYTCSAGTFANYCAPLVAQGCAEIGSVCKVPASWDPGTCLEYERTYNCNEKPDPLPTNVTYLSSSYTIVDDSTVSTCATPEGDPNCTQTSSVCTEGPETRNINGLDVYKACWKWEKEFACASTVLTDDCGDLKARSECLETTTPVCVDTLPSGACGLLEHTYECSIGAEKTQTVTDCSTQSFCVDGTCFDSSYSPDTDFGTAISSMEALRDASVYGLFKGEASECASKRMWGLANCCKTSSGGAGASNSALANAANTAAYQVGKEAVRVYGSEYIYEGLFSASELFSSTMLAEYGYAAWTWGLGVPSVSVYGVTISFGAAPVYGPGGALLSPGGTIFTFDPLTLAASIALAIIADMMSCDEEDQLTSMRRGQNLCHHVGSYCASKFLGTCRTKKQTYCCFVSKLAKIVQEQGRPQIGKGWGSGKHPDCSGFTLSELSSLDFSKMDFSEFITDIAPPGKDASYAIQRLKDKAAAGLIPGY